MKSEGTKGLAVVAVAVLALAAGTAMAKPASKKELSGVVNLNTATAAQLDLLPGIGQKAAKRIIEHRTKTPFARVEDLAKVKGFGPKKLEKLKPFLTVSGPTTVAVKTVKRDAESAAPSATAPPAHKPAQGQGRRAGSPARP